MLKAKARLMKITSGFYAFCAVVLAAITSPLNCLNQGHLLNFSQRTRIMWTKPEYNEMRFGFEVTMYIANR